jgi:hypothetical protein
MTPLIRISSHFLRKDAGIQEGHIRYINQWLTCIAPTLVRIIRLIRTGARVRPSRGDPLGHKKYRDCELSELCELSLPSPSNLLPRNGFLGRRLSELSQQVCELRSARWP